MRTVLIYKEDLLPISETFVLGQASSLRRYRPQYVGIFRSEPSLEGVGDAILVAPNIPKVRNRLMRRLYHSLGYAPRFHRALSRVEPHLLHAHFASSGRSAVRLARTLRVPLIVTLHGSDVTIKRNYRQLYAQLWRSASLFICVSDFIRRRAIDAGFPQDKLLVHYIGIDCTHFHPSPESSLPNLILFVGRLVEKKGLKYLIEAMTTVSAKVPAASLVVIGDGPLRASLESQAAGLGACCSFLGAQNHEEVCRWLKRATLLCVPSTEADNGDSEGLPIVLAEAQAMGVPVVSTQHAGIPELVIDGVTGQLVPERDSAALAEAIVFFLRNDMQRQAAAEAGVRRIASQFNIAAQTASLESIYDLVVDGKRVA
jgi:colanic acid/amylovoran biosynthesis glycosyltransferase